MFVGKGALTFRTYRVAGKKTNLKPEEIAEKLKNFRFTGLGSSDEGSASGWIAPEHLFDGEFDPAKLMRGHFACFALRVDSRKIPSPLVAAHCALEEKAWREANDVEKVPAAKRREIKREVRAKLTAEMPPKQVAFGVFWRVKQQKFYFQSTSKAANEELQDLFARTFDLMLEAELPAKMAQDTIGEGKEASERLTLLEGAMPLCLNGRRSGAGGECSFLGRDFLTWLWFRCEVDGGEFELPSSGASKTETTGVVVEDALALASVEEDGSTMTLNKGVPTARPEAANALAAGMTLRKARLAIARGTREWQVTVDGDTLDLLGLKTPPPEDIESEEEGDEPTSPDEVEESEGGKAKKKATKTDDEALDELAEKLASADEARDTVKSLFHAFLDVRLTKDWEKDELPRMQSWVETKLEKAAADFNLPGDSSRSARRKKVEKA